MKKKKAYTFTLNEELISWFRAYADLEDRSMSGLLNSYLLSLKSKIPLKNLYLKKGKKMSDNKTEKKGKKEFVSNVTGEEWYKHNSKKWNRVVGQVGTILEDEIHKGKKFPITLKKGSTVYIDDIRGRIKPQYRVRDTNEKVWFVSALNVQILEDKSQESDVSKHMYRGGVRHDGSKATPYRYNVDKTTEEEMKEARGKSNG